MIKEIYEHKKYDDLSLKARQFAEHLYKKYPNGYKIKDQILLSEAKALKISNKDIRYAVSHMIRIGDVYITKDHIGIVK